MRAEHPRWPPGHLPHGLVPRLGAARNGTGNHVQAAETSPSTRVGGICCAAECSPRGQGCPTSSSIPRTGCRSSLRCSEGVAASSVLLTHLTVTGNSGRPVRYCPGRVVHRVALSPWLHRKHPYVTVWGRAGTGRTRRPRLIRDPPADVPTTATRHRSPPTHHLLFLGWCRTSRSSMRWSGAAASPTPGHLPGCHRDGQGRHQASCRRAGYRWQRDLHACLRASEGSLLGLAI